MYQGGEVSGFLPAHRTRTLPAASASCVLLLDHVQWDGVRRVSRLLSKVPPWTLAPLPTITWGDTLPSAWCAQPLSPLRQRFPSIPSIAVAVPVPALPQLAGQTPLARPAPAEP